VIGPFRAPASATQAGPGRRSPGRCR
jgi:hypothetical protein